MIRLIRRLLPALVVVLAGCALLTIAIQPQTRWEAFANQSLASLGYYQNWELASTVSNYLRAGEAVSPLQHIWSMSVQGQFYLAFLLLVAGCAYLLRRLFRGPRAPYLRTMFVVLLSTLTLASFIYAIVAHHAYQATAYYNTFARAWELLAGALVGAVVPHVRWPMWLRTAVATAALAAILSCGALIDGVKEFPGPWALVPVGATMLMILAGANRQGHPGTRDRLPLPNRLLATAPLVALGAMAYSWYLWHWPLLIFWLSYTGHRHANFVEGAQSCWYPVAGIPDHPACRRPITLSGTRRREIAGGGPADSLAAAAASANDRAGICGGTAWRRSYRDLVHVA